MNNRIGLKDIVLVTLLTAIMIGIQTVVVMPFAVNLKFVLWFVGGIDGLLCGIIYCLMMAKAPKTGTAFFYSLIFAVYYFMVNSMIAISGVILGAGLLMELVLRNGGYKSKGKVTIAYVLFGVSLMMAPNLLILLQKDAMVTGLLANGVTQEYIDAMFSVYSAPNIGIGVLLTIVGSVVGTRIGFRVLNRYFVSSGIVEQ